MNPLGRKNQAAWSPTTAPPCPNGFLHIFCGQNCAQTHTAMPRPLICKEKFLLHIFCAAPGYPHPVIAPRVAAPCAHKLWKRMCASVSFDGQCLDSIGISRSSLIFRHALLTALRCRFAPGGKHCWVIVPGLTEYHGNRLRCTVHINCGKRCVQGPGCRRKFLISIRKHPRAQITGSTRLSTSSQFLWIRLCESGNTMMEVIDL